jgi:hypothetical protein
LPSRSAGHPSCVHDQLSNRAEDCEDHLAHRSAGIDAFGAADKLMPGERFKGPKQVRHRPGEPIELRDHDGVEPKPMGVGNQPIKFGRLLLRPEIPTSAMFYQLSNFDEARDLRSQER